MDLADMRIKICDAYCCLLFLPIPGGSGSKDSACNAGEFSYSRFILVIFNFFFFVCSQCFIYYTTCWWGFPGGSMVKNLRVKQETQVQCLGWEDSLEKGMATHFSILAWEIP